MRDDRPSLTAALVSFSRGAVSRSPQSPCFDPAAVALLPFPWRQWLLLGGAGPSLQRVSERLARVALGGLAGHVELRTALIDEAVRSALGDPAIRQVVVLGAGLDARAFRMTELSESDVYELDHPATQAWKRAGSASLRVLSRSLTFVPVNFERTSLTEALASTAHRPAAPTLWLWEGVTMYLPAAALEATLDAMAKRSAPGSRLALTYLPPETLARPRWRPFILPLFHLIREPLVGALTPQQMHERLRAHGFEVLEDAWPGDHAHRFGRRPLRGPFTPAERVLVAERR